jgi:hypothetical protein
MGQSHHGQLAKIRAYFLYIPKADLDARAERWKRRANFRRAQSQQFASLFDHVVGDGKHIRLLSKMAVSGKTPKLAVVITLDEVFFHCGKALKRARLWDNIMRIDRKSFPSYAEIIHHERLPNEPPEKIEQRIADNYQNELY